MAIDLQEVLEQTQQDMRQMLSAGGNSTLLLDYADRIHKQLLRLTEWRFLLSDVKTFQTQVGVTDYWIGPEASLPEGMVDSGLHISDIWRIKQDSVKNTTTGLTLSRIGEAPIGPLASVKMSPRQYRNDSSSPLVLSIYPPPDKVSTIQFRFYEPKHDLKAEQSVQLPEDYQDILVAGINLLGCQYLKRPNDIQIWAELFREGKKQMLRDQRGYGNHADFMKGDSAGITNVYVGPGIN